MEGIYNPGLIAPNSWQLETEQKQKEKPADLSITDILVRGLAGVLLQIYDTSLILANLQDNTRRNPVVRRLLEEWTIKFFSP